MDFDRYSRQAAEAVLDAEKQAAAAGRVEITPEHLLYAMLCQQSGMLLRLLASLGVDREDLKRRLQREIGGSGNPREEVFLSARLLGTMQRAERECRERGEEWVSTLHLFLALLDERGGRAAEHLNFFGVNRLRVSRALHGLRKQQKEDAPPQASDTVGETTGAAKSETTGAAKSETTGAPTKAKGDQDAIEPSLAVGSNVTPPLGEALRAYGRDLTYLAESGALDPVIGRDNEIRGMMQILSRRHKNNPLLVGEPGVGKTSTLYGLASRIVRGDVPAQMRNRRLVMLEMGSVIAGAKYRGDFEERLKAILQEVREAAGQILLVLPDLHTLIKAGDGQGGADASGLLKPALLRGEVQVIGTTTPEAYRQRFDKEPAFKRLFQSIAIHPPPKKKHFRSCAVSRRVMRSTTASRSRMMRCAPPFSFPNATSQIAPCPTKPSI